MPSVFFYKQGAVSAPPDRGWRWWFNVWIPVVVAVGVICVESTGTFSSEHTSSWLRPIFERLFGAFQDERWGELHHALRKSGHFLGYGTVGFTFLRAWLYTLGRRGVASLGAWRVEASALAVFSTALVASGDEIHQTFLPGRTGTPVDVALDSAGACAMCLVVWVIWWRRRSRAAG